MIQAVIFDMDGVIIDSEPLYQEAEERLFREYGVTIPDEDWNIFRGCTEERFYQVAQERYGIAEPLDTLRVKGRQYVMSVFSTRLDFHRGFQEIIGPLQERYRLGLVTSTAKDLFQWVDDKLGISRYFPEIITAGMTANSKPHPEPYLEMMRRLEVSPTQTAVVEDSIAGVQSALAAGAWTIALTGSVSVEDLPAAHRVIHSLQELSPVFFENLASAPQS